MCLFKRFALPFFGDSLFGWKLGLDLCYLSKKYRMCEAHCPGHIVLILGGGVGKPGGGGRQVLLASVLMSQMSGRVLVEIISNEIMHGS